LQNQISPTVTLIKTAIQAILTRRNFVWKGPSHTNSVALTFDDGPHSELTLQCLEILQKYGMQATFFLIGKNVERSSDIVANIHHQGHACGVHTYSHPFTLHQKGYSEVKSELHKTRDIIQNITGKKVSIYRPPRGQLSFRLLYYTTLLKFSTVLWNVSFLDHQKLGSEYLLTQIESTPLKPGDIILLHDNNIFTIETLPILLNRIREEGLKTVTVPDFLGYPN